MRSVFSLVYVVVGFFVAQGQGYLLWPLLLLGMNLRLG
jgi:hypothetical protein